MFKTTKRIVLDDETRKILFNNIYKVTKISKSQGGIELTEAINETIDWFNSIIDLAYQEGLGERIDEDKG